jgi:hypothetical protein
LAETDPAEPRAVEPEESVVVGPAVEEPEVDAATEPLDPPDATEEPLVTELRDELTPVDAPLDVERELVETVEFDAGTDPPEDVPALDDAPVELDVEEVRDPDAEDAA